ncbi:hypothetical protein BGZ60DRAFT_569190 [Tricladium varicosporioides]|nr:hypothetical protein BGZ60DRAFT_569190 [Hymenoscyphus varicosporioides]
MTTDKAPSSMVEGITETAPAIGGPRNSSRIGTLLSWSLEIVSCAFTCVLFAGIIVILRAYDHRPLPQMPFKISMNSLLSILVTIQKAMIGFVAAQGIGQLKWQWFGMPRRLQDMSTFDGASRGPTGAVYFLARVGFRDITTSLGCFVVILVLLADPFTQQTLQYYPCSIKAPELSATIPIANNFTTSGQYMGLSNAGVEYTLDNNVQNAIIAGFYQPNGSQVTFNCPTGNCTIPNSYWSLGVCNTCKDVSDQLTKSCDNHDTYYDLANKLCKSKLPSGHTLLPYPGANSTRYTYWNSTIGYTTATLPSVGTPYIGSMQVIGVHWSAKEKAPVYWEPNHVGIACTLAPCIKQFEATITAGKLSERVVETHLLPEKPNFSAASTECGLLALKVDCLNTEQYGKLEPKYSLDSQNGNNWINIPCVNATGGAIYPPTDIPPECLFNVGLETYSALHKFISGTGTGSSAGILTGVLDSIFFSRKGVEGPPMLQTLYDDGNFTAQSVEARLNGMATAATNYIRQHSAEEIKRPVTGDVYRSETCVRVRWYWLAPLAAVIALTILFMQAIIIRVTFTKQGVGSWKSSVLPLLFGGLDERTRDHLVAETEISGMAKRARGVDVKLSWTDKGWRLLE